MMHLGHRVGALVDGQMGPGEEERAWAHVHTCPSCRAAVEREGWVKRQLACLSLADSGSAPQALKGSLSSQASFAAYPDHAQDPVHSHDRGRRLGGLAAIGAGSVGAAMFGVMAFSAAPAQAPAGEGRVPPASFRTTPVANPSPGRDATTTNEDAADLVRAVVSAWRMGL